MLVLVLVLVLVLDKDTSVVDGLVPQAHQGGEDAQWPHLKETAGVLIQSEQLTRSRTSLGQNVLQSLDFKLVLETVQHIAYNI